MQTQWYADKRDVVKWATLVHLCHEHGLRKIIQVPFLNDGEWDHSLNIDGCLAVFPQEVWCHFRNLADIRRLAQRTHLDIQVIPGKFHRSQRDEYIDEVCRNIGHCSKIAKVVLLDPDTGIEPKQADARHVRVLEIERVWQHLKRGDWLVLYQPALRKKNWRSVQKRKFAGACGDASVITYGCEKIAHDVVFFCAERK